MKIVIDIPEEMYQKIKETSRIISGRRSGRSFDYILFNAINTGTPLPKGHGRLKDVDHYTRMAWEHPDYSLMDDEPTIIEADKEAQE